MNDNRKRAEKIVTDHRKALDAIASRLVEVETIEREDFEKLLIANGITPKKKEVIGAGSESIKIKLKKRGALGAPLFALF